MSEQKRMTLEDVKRMDRADITPAIAAQIMRCRPYYISVAARDDPGSLPFPVYRSGNRTHIPRLPFIAFMEGSAMAR